MNLIEEEEEERHKKLTKMRGTAGWRKRTVICQRNKCGPAETIKISVFFARSV